MKNKILSLSLSAKFNFASLFWIALLLLKSAITTGQTPSDPHNCGLEIPSEWRTSLARNAAAAKAYTAPSVASRVVPVRFSQFRSTSTFIAPLTQADVTLGLDNLNTAFAGAGITFVQCGKITVVEDNRFGLNADYDNFLTPFSYTSGAMEVAISAGGAINLAPIPPPSYLQGNPNSNAGFPYLHDNFVQLLLVNNLGTSTTPHEVGHHLGLLHTFMPTRSYVSGNPLATSQLDHPYAVLTGNPAQIDPGWWGRELVIRNEDTEPFSTRQFKIPNWDKGGDFIQDTPADCANLPGFFPGCPQSAQSTQTCLINPAQLTYKDYNNDNIFPPPAGLTLGNNYMSYWHENCRNTFTAGQNQNTTFYYDTYRKGQYFSNCNFDEEVEFWNTTIGLKKVNVRIRYDEGIKHKCNTFSQLDGSFSGVLHNNKIKSYITQNGFGTQKLYDNLAPRMHYKATPCEWAAGVNMDDVYMIQQHIFNPTILNGYQKIAADVNNNGIISTYDMQLIRQQLFGYIVAFPTFDSPWRFVPEYVPQIYTAGFDANPFNMDINGLTSVNAPKLCEGEYLFNMPSINGQKGFDGIKLGDVNGDWPSLQCTPPMEPPQSPGEGGPSIDVPSVAIENDKNITLSFNSKDFKSVTAFQMALQIPTSHFEYVSSTGGKPSFIGYEDDYFAYDPTSGIMKTVWYDQKVQPANVADATEVFKVNLKTKQPITSLSSLISLDGSSFQNKIWRGGLVLATDAAPSFTVTVSETVTDREGVSDQQQKANQFSRLTAFPNPVKGSINLLIENQPIAVEGQIAVRDINGKIVHASNHSIVEGVNEISLFETQSLPSGNYFIEVQLGTETLRTKVNKQ